LSREGLARIARDEEKPSREVDGIVVFNISKKLKVGKYRPKAYNMWKKKNQNQNFFSLRWYSATVGFISKTDFLLRLT